MPDYLPVLFIGLAIGGVGGIIVGVLAVMFLPDDKEKISPRKH